MKCKLALLCCGLVFLFMRPVGAAPASTALTTPQLTPSPPFRGEREGPAPQAREGEVGLSASVLASPTSPQPSPPPTAKREFSDLILEPRPGARLPLATELIDETGKPVTVSRFFAGKPVVLVLHYLRCRTICGVVLGNLADATAGRDYEILAISIDPRDTPADAAAAKAKYVTGGAPGKLAPSWHFLTGPEAAVRPIADAVGFRYRYDPASDQYIHSAGIVIVARDGAVGGYLSDLDITPAGLSSALDAVNSAGTAGSFGRLLLLCFGGGAQTGRYTAAIEAALVCLNLAGMLSAVGLFAWARRRRHD